MAEMIDSGAAQDWLGAPVTEQQIDAAEGLVRGRCGWHIAPVRTETVRVSTRGVRTIPLPTLRLVDVTAVTTLDGAPVGYDWDTDGVLTLARSVPRVLVTMTHGYAETPADLTVALFSLLKQAGELSSYVGQSMTVGPFSVTARPEIGSAGSLSIGGLDAAVLDRYTL